ncbi:hypothetical protein [Aeromicrobium sp. CTD01-1L150]|uniref:FitA-like ribbon-helix-helix domain-containing protein n=1 Tax=Aeromicrobium sp. CTD01-1L150 TaxID=3341830 RepID=UPI0035C0E4E7
MPSIQIKNVPEQAHAVLRERAARAHQSLQEYLLGRLIAETERPTMAELMAEIEGREDNIEVAPGVLVDLLHEERAGR